MMLLNKLVRESMDASISGCVREHCQVCPTMRAALTSDLAKRALAMRVALDNLMVHYVSLAETGDCGSWEAEEQDEIKQARKAVADFDEVAR